MPVFVHFRYRAAGGSTVEYVFPRSSEHPPVTQVENTLKRD